MKATLGYLFVLLATLTVASCGFQLRGSAEVPESMRELELVMPSGRGELGIELRRTLRVSGIDVVAGAPQTLEILKEKQGRRTASLTEDIKVDEYELRTEVSYQVTQGDALLIPPTMARAARVYSYDRNAITAESVQEALLRREMQQDIARQILQRYLFAAGTPSNSP